MIHQLGPRLLVAALVALACLPLAAQKAPSPQQLVADARKAFKKDEFGDAARVLTRALAVPGLDAATTADARNLLDESRQKFLTTWYAQANFFQTGESRFGNFQITPDYEMGLGRAVNFTTTPSSDTAAQQHLQQLLARLMQGTPKAGLECTVQLIALEHATAVTVPGRMLIATGLLPLIETEADMAAVMAHEIAHLYGHHASRRLIKQARGQALVNVIGGAVAGAGGGQTAQALTAVAGTLGVALFTRAYERFEESEADRYAAHLMFNAGYNPTALSTVFLRMYRANARQPLALLSTHPPLPNRIEGLTAYLEAFPLERELAIDSVVFQRTVKHRDPSTTAPVAAAPPPPVAASPPSSSLPPVSPPPVTSLPPVAPPPASALPPVTPPPVSALPPVTPPPAASLPPVVLPPARALPPVMPPSPNLAPIIPPAPASRPLAAPTALVPSASAAVPGFLFGTWSTPDGDLVVRFSSTSQGVIGALVKVPRRWTRDFARESDVLLRNARTRDAWTVTGENLSAPLDGDCPQLPRKWGPTSIKTNTMTGLLTVSATFYKYLLGVVHLER